MPSSGGTPSDSFAASIIDADEPSADPRARLGNYYNTAPGDRGRDLGRADEGNRTPNLLITNQLLYQLSYVSGILES
jgi:hypothetical protein